MTPGEATREFYRKQGRLEEQARIIKLLENWDSLTVFDANDPVNDIKILQEMRRAYQVGYDQSWEDNK